MTGTRWLITLLLGAAMARNASAQVIAIPTPVVGVPVLVPNGIGFTYNSRRVKAAGFIPTGGVSTGILPVSPYGVPVVPVAAYPYYYPGYYTGYGPVFPPVILGAVESRTSLQIINPPGLVPQRRGPGLLDQDIAGIDLDVEPAAKIWGKKPAGVKVAPDRELAKDARKDEKPVKPPIPPALPPKVELVPEVKQLLDNGITAFRNGEYGIAILRFRQLAEDDPPLARAMFLQGQAFIAVGKYRDAAELLRRALKRQPDWVRSEFRPRVELYGNNAELWKQHVDRLDQAQRLQPKNADFLYLQGYMSWFDGERDAALVSFRAARPLADDPRVVDLFLNAGK
jgi:hypothetical protein